MNRLCTKAPGNAGFVLIPVVLMLVLVASVAFLVSLEGGMNTTAVARGLHRDAARYVAEAGFADAQHQLALNSTCEGFANLPAKPFGAHSYFTEVSPAAGSPVKTVTTASLDNGAMSVLTRNATTYQDASTSIFQPGSEGKDAFIEGQSGHTAHNKADNLELRVSSDPTKPYRSLLQFDLTSLPASSKIESAVLELGVKTSVALDEIEVFRLTRSWTEAGVTWESYNGTDPWASPGGDYDPDPLGRFIVSAAAAQTVDVTGLVERWLGGVPNHGLVLISTTASTGENKFHSADEANVAHPKLTITFRCECGDVCSGLSSGETIVLSTGDSASLGGLTFDETDLAKYTSTDDTGDLFFDGSANSLDKEISAVHVFEDGTYLLSTAKSDDFGGLAFEAADLVRYDPATDTASMFFEGSVHFTDSATNLNAVHLLNDGHLVLSTSESAELGGLTFEPTELIEYDPGADTAIVFFDGAAYGLTEGVSAVHVLENGTLVLGVEKATMLAGIGVAPGDLVQFNPTSGSANLFLSKSAFADPSEEIGSVHILGDSGPAIDSTPGLVALWKFDETTGDLAMDATGGHHGSVIGDPTWRTDGKIEGTLDFAGSNDSVSVPHSDPLSLTSEFTITAWINSQSFAIFNSFRILSKEPTGTNDGYWMSLQSQTLWVGVGGSFYSAPTSFSRDQWYHVGMTFSDEDDALIIYVDGSNVAEYSSTATIAENTAPLTIGANWQSFKYWDGMLDDVRIYDRVLTSTEIGEVKALSEPPSGSCDNTLSDRFDAVSFGNNDGSLSWAATWDEINESDGPSSGDTEIGEDPAVSNASNLQLRLRDNDGGGEGVEREADTSSATSLALSIDYRRSGLDSSSDYVTLEISDDGGSSWTELDRFAGLGTDSAYTSVTYDVTDYISANTMIRLLTSSSLGGWDTVYFDNLELCLTN